MTSLKARPMTSVLVCAFSAVAALHAGELENSARQVSVCGPRCVQQVLQYYGQDPDLIELISEMQQGRVDEFSSIQDIQDALHKRGVQTLVLQLGLLQFPDPTHPVILHYKQGHFVVLEKSQGGFASIRDGAVSNSSREFIPSVMSRSSGVALMTSPTLIKGSDVSILLWPRVSAAVACLGFGGLGFLIRLRTKRVDHFISRERRLM